MKDMLVKVMEKCPKCRGEFPSKDGFMKVMYKGQVQLVCLECYLYLDSKQKLLEKKQKLNKENTEDRIKPFIIQNPLHEPNIRPPVRSSNKKLRLQHQDTKKKVVRTTDDLGITTYAVVRKNVRKKPNSKKKKKIVNNSRSYDQQRPFLRHYTIT